MLLPLKPVSLGPVLHSKRSQHKERSLCTTMKSSPSSPQLEKAHLQQQRPSSIKKRKNTKELQVRCSVSDMAAQMRPPLTPVSSVQFSSVTQLCLTLCHSMNRSTPGLPVHHQLPEFTQTHIHRVSDAIQPSHPLASPSPPAPNPSQHQSLFQ